MLTWMALYPLVYVMLASMLRIFGINIFSSLNKFIIALFFSFITTVWTIVAINEDKNGYTLIAVSRRILVLIWRPKHKSPPINQNALYTLYL